MNFSATRKIRDFRNSFPRCFKMQYQVKLFHALHPDSAEIRKTVFMQEQGFQQEFDEIDSRAVHAVVYDGDCPIATGRLFTERPDCYVIGRVAVLPDYRGKHVGNAVVQALEAWAKEHGGKSVSLSAQCRVSGFYEKLGYQKTNDTHMDEFCPHVTMEKKL